MFVFVEYCHLLELYIKCAALYRTFIRSRSGIRHVVVREGEHSILPGRWSRQRDGRWSGIVQTENTARHTKYGRIRGMVAGEGGRSTGVLL